MAGLGQIFVEICSGRNVQKGMQLVSRVSTTASRSGGKTLATVRTGTNAGTQASASTNVLQMRSQPACDIVTSARKLTFGEVYDIVKLGNGRIKLLPKISQINGRNIIPLEMPEYLYHVTSEANFNLIRSSNNLKISSNEQLRGVFLLDKENFLTRYLSVGKNKRNLCKSIITHANNTNKGSSNNLVVIRIPTEHLARNGNFRIRTQEDFFNFQDEVIRLQQGLKQKYSLRLLADDGNRAKFIKHVLDNKLMTKAELDQFMKEMEQKIHQGYQLNSLSQLEKNSAVEYIYNHDISPDTIPGIKCRRFSVNDCINPQTGQVNIDYLSRLFN